MMMHSKIGLLFLLALSISLSTVAQSSLNSYRKAHQILLEAVQKSGGLAAFQQIEDIQMTLAGTAYDEGQSANPYSYWFERDLHSEIIFLTKEGQSYQKTNSLTIGGLLYDPVFILNKENTGLLNMVSTQEWFELKGYDIPILKSIPQLYPPRMFSFVVLQKALSNLPSLRYIQKRKGEHHIAVAENDGTQLTLVFSDKTKLLKRVEILSDHLVFGDTQLNICYEDYRSVDSVLLPHRLIIKYDNRVFIDLQVKNIQCNTSPSPGIFDKPEEFPFTPMPKAFHPQSLGDGVWFIPVYVGLGITYNVLLVEFEDYFLVADAPLYDGYSRAIEQIAQSIAPEKPIKYVVATHCHTDHIGGINHFIAKGSTIVCNNGNQQFIKELAKVKHHLFPNAQTFSPKEAITESFSNQKTFSDKKQSLLLYEINDSPHVEEMILVYLPKQKILFVADLLMVLHNGSLPPDNPSLQFLKNFIAKNKLEVELFAPAHGPTIEKDLKPKKSISKINETAEVEHAVQDYLEAFYSGDTLKLHRSILPEVYKYGYYQSKENSVYVGEAMSFQEMHDYALSVKQRGSVSPKAPKKIEVLDVQNQTAAVKLTAWWGTDYLLLAKYNKQWKIVQVLWQSPPEK